MSIIRSDVAVGSGASLTINVPAGTPADAEVVIGLLHDDGSRALSMNEAGWTELYNQGATGQKNMAVFARTLAASPPASYQGVAGGTGTGDFKAVIFTLDPDGGSIDAVTNCAGRVDIATTAVTNNLTGVANPSTLLALFVNDSAYTLATPSGMTLLESDTSSASSIYAFYQLDAGTGTLSKSADFSGSDEWGTILVLFEETAGVGGDPEAGLVEGKLLRGGLLLRGALVG